jgi:hypothetical protein
MQPEANGRFCGSCEKIVVDFTQMSTTEIQDYFRRSEEIPCGRFQPYQIEAKGNRFHRSIIRLQQYIDEKVVRRSFSKSLVGLLGIVLFISGCRTRYSGAPAYGYNVRFLDSVRDRQTPSLYDKASLTDHEKLVRLKEVDVTNGTKK